MPTSTEYSALYRARDLAEDPDAARSKAAAAQRAYRSKIREQRHAAGLVGIPAGGLPLEWSAEVLTRPAALEDPPEQAPLPRAKVPAAPPHLFVVLDGLD